MLWLLMGDRFWFWVMIVFVVGVLAFSFCFSGFDLQLTGYAVFSDSDSSFNNGVYENTFYNGSGVVLAGENLSGSYVSEVFDAGADADWNNMSWVSGDSSVVELYVVDGNADVWESVNAGVDWSLVKDDYTGGDSNGATYMVSNSSGSLFVLFNQDVWRSDDFGVTWVKVCDDINPSATNDGQVMSIDSNGYIYVVDGADRVLKSENYGVDFVAVNESFGEGPNAGGMVVGASDDIFIIDNSANVWRSTNGC